MYPSDSVHHVLHVGSLLHLVSIVVRVEDRDGVEMGAGPPDGLVIQLQGAHPVLLLYAMTQQLPVSARGPAGQPGVDGVRGVPVIHCPGGGAEEICQAGGDFQTPVPASFLPSSPPVSPSLLPAGPHGQRGFLGNKQEEPPFPEGPEHLARPGWFISLLLMKTQELLWRAMSLPPRAAGPPLDLDATKETAQAKTAGTAEAGPTHVCIERSLR